MLTLKDFDFELPQELVAPYPARKRSEAGLLVLDRTPQKMEHRIFKDLPDYLRPGDLLVLNNTKVLPARLFGRKLTGGRVEALLLKQKDKRVWEILAKPNGRIKKGACLTFGEMGIRIEGEILDEPDGVTGIREIRFLNGEVESIASLLKQIGHIPIPPYLDRPDEPLDRELYQTVFAEVEGAAASPTAGLHFDEELLETLRGKGIEICYVTLHISYGTFQPVETENLSKHKMYEEEFEVSEQAMKQIQCAREAGRRIVACGTTVVRVLETIYNGTGSGGTGTQAPGSQGKKGTTRLFIYPPYEFQVVDAMITNFHLPGSTLLMLVSAFAGRELIFQAYREAIRERRRFYSYGDAMLIL